MPKQIYELGWKIYCDEFEFFKTQWKVFESESDARVYGLQEQDDANDGLPPTQAASRGYCYRFMYARLVDRIDGYPIVIDEQGFFKEA